MQYAVQGTGCLLPFCALCMSTLLHEYETHASYAGMHLALCITAERLRHLSWGPAFLPPSRRGTVYEIQAVLKRDCASCLDKYQTPKGVRWKLAVSVSGQGGQARGCSGGEAAALGRARGRAGHCPYHANSCTACFARLSRVVCAAMLPLRRRCCATSRPCLRRRARPPAARLCGGCETRPRPAEVTAQPQPQGASQPAAGMHVQQPATISCCLCADTVTQEQDEVLHSNALCVSGQEAHEFPACCGAQGVQHGSLF